MPNLSLHDALRSDVKVNGVFFAKAEVVMVEGQYGLKFAQTDTAKDHSLCFTAFFAEGRFAHIDDGGLVRFRRPCRVKDSEFHRVRHVAELP